MKNKSRHLVAATLSRTGVTSIVKSANQIFQPHRALVLMYHRLKESCFHQTEFSPGASGPSTDLFDRQMRHLKRNYNVIPLQRLVSFFKQEDDLPRNAVAITFDDGYKDTFTLAYPILKKYDLPATVFLTTGFVGTQRLLWYDKVHYVLRHTTRDAIALNGHLYPTDSLIRKKETARNIVRELKKLSETIKCELIEELEDTCGISVEVKEFNLALSWDEVREMARYGISFGAHTVNHPILTRVSKETARGELLESKSTIESELQESVNFFAYPNGEPGDFNEETRDIVRDCGYDSACTSIYGPNLPTSDRFALRRLWIGPNDSVPIFSAKLAGIFPLRSRLKRTFQR